MNELPSRTTSAGLIEIADGSFTLVLGGHWTTARARDYGTKVTLYPSPQCLLQSEKTRTRPPAPMLRGVISHERGGAAEGKEAAQGWRATGTGESSKLRPWCRVTAIKLSQSLATDEPTREPRKVNSDGFFSTNAFDLPRGCYPTT